MEGTGGGQLARATHTHRLRIACPPGPRPRVRRGSWGTPRVEGPTRGTTLRARTQPLVHLMWATRRVRRPCTPPPSPCLGTARPQATRAPRAAPSPCPSPSAPLSPSPSLPPPAPAPAPVHRASRPRPRPAGSLPSIFVERALHSLAFEGANSIRRCERRQAAGGTTIACRSAFPLQCPPLLLTSVSASSLSPPLRLHPRLRRRATRKGRRVSLEGGKGERESGTQVGRGSPSCYSYLFLGSTRVPGGLSCCF